MRSRHLLLSVLVLIVCNAAGAASSLLAPAARGGGVPDPGCEDGLILDDGSYETAYGWISSAEWGEYVQTFQIDTPHLVVLESVCVCWTRTRDDDSLDFEVEIYEDVEGVPAAAPLVVVPASMNGVPAWPDAAFVEVPLGIDAAVLKSGIYHVGARWGPSVDQYFFICADQSDPDSAVPGFLRDDRSEGEWGSMLETSDPIFADHTAMLVRVRSHEVWPTPAVGRVGAGALIVAIGLCAWWRLRHR